MQRLRYSLTFATALALVLAPLSAQPSPQFPVPPQLDLKGAMGFAIENNFAIRQAKERIRQQDGVVVEVSARQIPTVAANATYQQNDREISSAFPASDRAWAINLTASQVLYAGGGVAASVQISSRRMLDLPVGVGGCRCALATAQPGQSARHSEYRLERLCGCSCAGQ